MTLLWCVTPNPAVLTVFLVGLSCRGHWDFGIISDSLVWEPATSYVAIQNQKKLLHEQATPLSFQLQRLNVFVLSEREGCSQMASRRPMHFSWANEDLSCRYPGGAVKWSKRGQEWCDRIKAFFNLFLSVSGNLDALRTFDSTENTWPFSIGHISAHNIFCCSPFIV